MRCILKKWLHSFVLLSYINLLVTQAYGASYNEATSYIEIEPITSRRGPQDLNYSVKFYDQNKLIFETTRQQNIKTDQVSFKKKQNGYHFRCRNAHQETLKLVLDTQGNMKFLSQKHKPSRQHRATWGIKTHGTLSNDYDLSLYGLYTHAHQFINTGALLLKTFSFSQLYGFNSGMIHVSQTDDDLDVASLFQHLKSLGRQEKPHYVSTNFDNVGYFYSDKEITTKNLAFHNYGLCHLDALNLTLKSSLTAHSPITLVRAVKGHASSIVNHSYIQWGRQEAVFEADSFVNKGILKSFESLILSEQAINQGLKIDEKKAQIFHQSHPFSQNIFLVQRLYTLLSSTQGGQQVQKNIAALFYHHKKASFAAMIVNQWRHYALPIFHHHQPQGWKQLKALIEALASESFDKKKSTIHEGINYLSYKAQVLPKDLFKWIMDHPDHFQRFVIKRLSESSSLS